MIDFTVPEECEGQARFGIRSYIDPELEETARQSSVTNSFAEILDLWRENYFGQKAGLVEWKGTATELLREMQLDESIEKLLRDVNARIVGRRLAAMVVQGFTSVKFKRQPGSGRREYTILSGKEALLDEHEGDPF